MSEQRFRLARTRGRGSCRPATLAFKGWVRLLALAAASACGGGDMTARDSMVPDDLSSRITAGTAPVILDVRTPEEFACGHIPGAINVPHTELEERLGSLSLPRDEAVVVHCETGARAAIAESLLREAGYEEVRDLRGHMQAWRAGDYPLATPAEPERCP